MTAALHTSGRPTWLQVLAGIILTLFIFCASVVFTLNFRPLYCMDIGLLDIAGTSGYTEDVIRDNYDALIDYNSIFFDGELSFPDLPMSESGRIHFEEVKDLFALFQYGAAIFGILAVFLLIWLWRIRKKTGSRNYFFLKLSAILTVALPVVFGLAIAVNWEGFFVAFHRLMFNNDYWIFDAATDPVITILPDAFFMHCALMILAIILAACGIMTLLYRKLKKQ